MTMTNNPTIDGVSLVTIEKGCDVIEGKYVPTIKVSLAPCHPDDNSAWNARNEAGEKIRALLDAPAVERQHKLSVWEGPMPESNGKSNFTVILHSGDMTEGICVYRSEYPDRARYEADCFRHLIGDPAFPEKPFVCDYDADKHSGYVKPQTESPEVAALQSTIAQLEDKLNKAIDLDFHRRETIARLEGKVQELESGRVDGIWFPRELGDGLAELIAEKARVCGGGAFDIWEEVCERFGNAQPAPFAAALECELGSPPLEHLRDLLKLVVDPGTYPVAVLHNQIRATLATMACLDATAALNGERK